MATANVNLSAFDPKQVPSGKNLSIALVVSSWNSSITENLFEGAKQTLMTCGVLPSNIKRWDVPGSFELVYGAKKALEDQPDAVIVIGSVIQGETKHFDFVCHGVTQGITTLNLTAKAPVIFCVLTDNTIQQAEDRSCGRTGIQEAAVAALQWLYWKIIFPAELCLLKSVLLFQTLSHV